MERLKLAGTASEKRSACLQEEFAASPDDTNVARTSTHCCCEQNTLSPSFMTKQRSSLVLVLREKWDEPTKKNGAWTVTLWFLGGRLVCSSRMTTTFLAIWRLPSIKVRMSALRTFTKTSFRALGYKHVDTRGLHTKKDRIVATNETKWTTRKYKTETRTTLGTSAMEQTTNKKTTLPTLLPNEVKRIETPNNSQENGNCKAKWNGQRERIQE